MTTYRWFMSNLSFRPSVARLLAEVTVDQVLGEFHTPKIQDLRVRLHAPVDGHADLPRSRKDVLILDGGFVQEVIGARGGKTFDHVQSFAVKISGSVQPGHAV